MDTSGGYYNYARTSTAITEHLATTLRQDTSTSKLYLDVQGGAQYGFSAPTADSNEYCRLEYIKDATGGQISLEYNGAVGTGRLTKVTDNDSKTVQYAYGTDDYATRSRFITKVTDKKGIDTNLSWIFDEVDTDIWEADYITLTDAASLDTTYDRSLSTSANTITNKVSGTNVGRVKYTPLSATEWHVRYADVYRDTTNYDRWTYNYASNRDLTKVQRPGTIDHTVLSYTSKGRLSTGHTGSDGDTTWAYASGGIYPTKMTDRAGLDTTYSYDSYNRLTKTVTPWSGSNGVQYAYDSYGQATS
ncbi:MAG: hypothetical protein HY706_22295, partial [Candidatus Hydrogenedentes bacterium]|nr:hypothetical protein [Candidatus Hydrogenedentota bacterium]